MAKLTRRSYKRKKVAFAAVILGGVALVSSGFAAWVLSSDASQNNNGGIKHGTITDGTLNMKVYSYSDSAEGNKGDLIENNPEKTLAEYFSFDADEKDTGGTPSGTDYVNRMYWQAKEGEKPERLSNKFVVEITSDADTLSSFNLRMSISNGSFDKAVTAEYVALPDCLSNNGVKIDKWSDSTTASGLSRDSYTAKQETTGNGYKWTIVYTISFEWGGRFNKKNPCYFFDSADKSTNTEDARTASEDDKIGKGYGTKPGYEISNADIKTDMKWFTDQIDAATYTITFEAKSK